jgi:hypothetical protein
LDLAWVLKTAVFDSLHELWLEQEVFEAGSVNACELGNLFLAKSINCLFVYLELGAMCERLY